MLETLGNHPEGECLNPSDGFVPGLPVRLDASQGWDFSNPPTVDLSVDLDLESHGQGFVQRLL